MQCTHFRIHYLIVITSAFHWRPLRRPLSLPFSSLLFPSLLVSDTQRSIAFSYHTHVHTLSIFYLSISLSLSVCVCRRSGWWMVNCPLLRILLSFAAYR
jgi:hypothetical protein